MDFYALEPLAEVISVQVMPKIHSNMFGQVVGGELVIRCSLLEIVDRSIKEWDISGYFDDSHGLDLGGVKLHFIPLGTLQVDYQRPVDLQSCTGLIVREVVQDLPGSRQAFMRVGHVRCREFCSLEWIEEKLKSRRVEEVLLV